LVLDPCLQFNVRPDDRSDERLLRPYVAVYGHNFSDYYIAHVKAWAASQKLPLVSIGYRNDWADQQWITADPHDFAHFMSASTAVVTNFFHGCVFALRNEKPFVCESSPYRGNKLQGLMVKTGADKHLVTDKTPAAMYNQRLSEPIDATILQKIDELRAVSNEYLDHAIVINKLKTV
jgi:hypothetical protein